MDTPTPKAPLPTLDFPAMEAMRQAQTQAYEVMLVRMRAAMNQVFEDAQGQVRLGQAQTPAP